MRSTQVPSTSTLRLYRRASADPAAARAFISQSPPGWAVLHRSGVCGGPLQGRAGKMASGTPLLPAPPAPAPAPACSPAAVGRAPSFCLHLCRSCCLLRAVPAAAASEPGACAAQATGSRGASGGATTSSSTSASAWPRRATPSSASAPAPAPAPSAVHPRPGMRPLRGDAPAESGALAQVQAAAGGLLRVPAPRQGGNPCRPPRALRPHFPHCTLSQRARSRHAALGNAVSHRPACPFRSRGTMPSGSRRTGSPRGRRMTTATATAATKGRAPSRRAFLGAMAAAASGIAGAVRRAGMGPTALE